jgi:hypothetical protein
MRGEKMALPFPKSANDRESAPRCGESETMSCAGYAAAGALVAGGILLLAGKRRAGMVAAASGTALALLDQQDTLQAWWNILPIYLEDLQRVLGQVQSTVDELSVQRERLRRVLAR